MVVLTNRVLELALEWSRLDPNETTAKYLEELLDRARRDNDEATKSQIIALFPEDNSRIGFGTAGLRAAMDIGPLRMNDMVIVQTAQGIATYCKEQNPGVSPLRAIVGYDHRSNPKFSLSSLSFAILTVLVFQQAGIECILLDGFVATPLVPFCTTRLGAVVGIMVTASHNPKEDAGYKVYWKDGCQIRPPVDKDIAKAISEQLTPWTDYRTLLSDRRNMYAHSPTFGLSNPELTTSLKNQYFEAIRGSGLVSHSTKQSSSLVTPPAFCYTAMHGVGHSFATQVFSVFGLAPFLSVPEQEAPDPMFPTVSFPNPEEKGALDLAKAFAEKHACDVVLANDPDADRLAVAERNRQTGEWYVFTGDEIGALLGSWLWEIMGKNSSKPVAMCASAVSSRLLSEMARVEGFHYEDTLTGFKWIGSRASELNKGNYNSIFCYEEAIGFCCGNVVFDKDGISALGVFAELTHWAYSKGLNLTLHLQNLYNKYGEFVSNNGYFFLDDSAVVYRIFDEMRNHGKYMTNVGPYEVTNIRDLGEPGYDSSTADNHPTLPTSRTSPMMTISFSNGCVAQFRASGTEPKFKYYLELRGKPGVSRSIVHQELMEMTKILLHELLRPQENGLYTSRKGKQASNL